jgi:hypothetical protein
MTTPAAYDALLSECYNKFYAKVFMIDLCPKKLITLTVAAMETVEPTGVDGSTQKSMVIKMLQRFINNSQMNEKAKNYYLKLVENGLVGAVIEVIIASTKNKVGVNSPIVVKKSGCM